MKFWIRPFKKVSDHIRLKLWTKNVCLFFGLLIIPVDLFDLREHSKYTKYESFISLTSTKNIIKDVNLLLNHGNFKGCGMFSDECLGILN